MAMRSELQERQEMELEAIKAIYDLDVMDCRTGDVWKVWRPPEFVIHLRPTSGMSFPSGSGDSNPTSAGSAVIDLHISFTHTYPDDVPKLIIENQRNMGAEDITELEHELNETANERKGQEMILDIAQNVQNFLHNLEMRKKALLTSPGDPKYSSFYEEMQSRRKLQLQEDQIKSCEESLLKRKQELAAIEQELKRREEDVNDLDKSPERPPSVSKSRGGSVPPNQEKTTSGPSRQSSVNNALANRTSSWADNCGVSVTKLVVKGVLQKLYKGAKLDLGHDYGRFGSVNVWIRECSAMVEETGQLVTLTEWSLCWAREATGRSTARETIGDREEIGKHVKLLESIEREFQALVKLDHSKLIRFLGFDWKQLSDRFQMTVVKDSLPGFFVQKYLDMGCALVPEQLRLLAMDILEALEYLHSKSILHRNITPNSVFQSVQCYLLVDFSAGARIHEVCQGFAKAFSPLGVMHTDEVDFAAPMSFAGLGRISQKSDILMLGHVILSLALGYTTPKDKPPLLPPSLPAELDQFLQCCVTRQEAEKWTAALLREHPFVVRPKPAVPRPDTDLHNMYGPKPAFGGASRDAANAAGNATGGRGEDLDDEETEPVIPSLPVSGSSRLVSEFDMLLWLGKGGFGDVVKVRNRLDGNIYAIKRIALKPSSRAFNKKITREVKLLSRLNHENVVRYFNSWIETTTESIREEAETTTPSDDSSKMKIGTTLLQTDKADAVDNDEAEVMNLRRTAAKDPFAEDSLEFKQQSGVFPRKMSSRDWSSFSRSGFLGCSSTGTDDTDNSSDSEDEGDGLNVFGGGSFYPMPTLDDDQDDDDVMFECSATNGEHDELSMSVGDDGESSSDRGNPVNTSKDDMATGELHKTTAKIKDGVGRNRRTKSESSSVATTASSTANRPALTQMLYIQMEFCEKNTLRQLIDSEELMGNEKRSWRLFREILEGLVHIHQQGMIHRDLKPVNIFMDSNDHVKIGDFGLATKGLLQSSTGFDKNASLLDSSSLSNDTDGHLTGRVGTALYVASELMTSGKASYTQKVDMYSLGIILFEIFSPCRTGMERVKTLTELRHPHVRLPKEFEEKQSNHKQVLLLRWLLRHEPEARPSSEELLASPLVPPAEMEDREFHQALVTTLNAPRTRKYHHLMSALFDRQMSYVQDYVYDNEIFKDSFSARYSFIMENVSRRLTRIFQCHGGLLIETPSLIPKSELSNAFDQSPYTLVEPGGTLVYLPYDLRLSFARWVARHDVTQIKRYVISKVFRAQKAVGAHPRELREAAFDIICPPSNAPVAIAELLETVLAVTKEFEFLRNRKYCLKLNHVSLLKAIMIYHGIEEKSLQSKVLSTLGDTKREGLSGFAREARLKSLEIPEDTVRSLIGMLEKSGSYARINSEMRCITHRKKSQTTELAREGLREMESVKQALESIGFPHPIEISMALVFNVNEYDGHVMFHFVSEAPLSTKQQQQRRPGRTSSKPSMAEVLAAGGRYDRLIANFQYHSLAQSPKIVSGVGVSFAFDHIVFLQNQMMTAKGKKTVPGGGLKGSNKSDGRTNDNNNWSGNSSLVKSSSSTSNNSVSTNMQGSAADHISHDSAVVSGVAWSRIQLLVLSTGSKPLLREKLKLAKKCWDLNLSADYLPQPVSEVGDIQEAYAQSGLLGLVILKESDTTQVRVKLFNLTDRDRVVEKKIHIDEFSTFIAEKLGSFSFTSFRYFQAGGHGGLVDPSMTSEGSQATQASHRTSAASISESNPNSLGYNNSVGGGNATLSNLKIQFVVAEKLAYNTRKRYEQQIQKNTCTTVQRFSPKETIELIATDLPGSVIKHWTAHFDLRDELGLKNSTFESALKFNKYKRPLLNVSDFLSELRFDKQCAVIFVYSLSDDCFRVVL